MTARPERKRTVEGTGIQPKHRLYGLNFSPYAEDQSPIEHSPIPTEKQIRRRLELVSSFTNRIRIFNSTGICREVTQIALELGFQLSLGAWISGDPAENETVLKELIELGQHPQVHTLVVGNEVLMRGELPCQELMSMIARVKKACPNKQITTAVVLKTLQDHPEITDQVDIIYANLHPYFADIPIAQAFELLQQQHGLVAELAHGTPILISETGWPCPDGRQAGQFLDQFLGWTQENNIPYYYFSAFDEPWKANDEGPWGAYFGLWQNDEQLKPGYQEVFYHTEKPAQ